MKKSRINLITISVLMILTFIFIGSFIVEAQEKEITIVYVLQKEWMDQAKEFTEKTGIKVNYLDTPFTDLKNRCLAYFMAGSTDIDVIALGTDSAAEFGDRGFLTPLKQFVKDGDLDGLSDASLQNLSWNGELYGLPQYIWPWQLYYNREILNKAGYTDPPKTWDEMIEMGKKIKELGYIPHMESWSGKFAAYAFYLRVYSEGGEVLNEEGKPAFNSEAGNRALKSMIKLYETGTVTEITFEGGGTSDVGDRFVQGNVCFCLAAPHLYPQSIDKERSKVEGKIGVALIPGAKLRSASWVETSGCAIPSLSKRKELAWEYLKFVASAEQQKKIALSIGRVPSRFNVLHDKEVLDKYPHFSFVEEQLQYPHGMIKSPFTKQIVDILAQYVVSAIRGLMQPEQALKQAELEILDLFQ